MYVVCRKAGRKEPLGRPRHRLVDINMDFGEI
jgi:hypothetical protein